MTGCIKLSKYPVTLLRDLFYDLFLVKYFSFAVVLLRQFDNKLSIHFATSDCTVFILLFFRSQIKWIEQIVSNTPFIKMLV